MAEVKIDRRHRYGIMLDTETANTITEDDGKLNMQDVLPYDIGFAVIDSNGTVYETFSCVNSDIFYDKPRMESAYYAKKIPIYIQDLANGKRVMKNTYEIRKVLLDKIAEYECEFVCAHNARFDVVACNNIQRWTTKSKYRYFFPKSVEIWDTLKMARDTIGKTEDYAQAQNPTTAIHRRSVVPLYFG